MMRDIVGCFAALHFLGTIGRQSKRMALLIVLILIAAMVAAHAQNTYFSFPQAPNTLGTTPTSVTCGSSSTPLGVTGNSYISIQIPPGGQNVCFALKSTAATLNPPSQCFGGGTTFGWGGGTLTCIVASGSQAITVETK
jgi:hypothetical protein